MQKNSFKQNQSLSTNIKKISDSLGYQVEEITTQMAQLKLTTESQLSKMQQTLKENRQNIVEKDTQKSGEIESLNKRMRLIVNEIDDQRKTIESQVSYIRRIEQVEAKAQDVWEMLEHSKKGGQQSQLSSMSGDNFQKEIKELSNQLSTLKHSMAKKIEELRNDMTKGFELNNCQALEKKLNTKINETVMALTR